MLDGSGTAETAFVDIPSAKTDPNKAVTPVEGSPVSVKSIDRSAPKVAAIKDWLDANRPYCATAGVPAGVFSHT
jgi:hypothetical protein